VFPIGGLIIKSSTFSSENIIENYICNKNITINYKDFLSFALIDERKISLNHLSKQNIYKSCRVY